MGRGEIRAARGLGLGGDIALLLLPGGGGLNRMILLFVIGGGSVIEIPLAIRFGAIAVRGRGGRSGMER